MDLTLSDAKVKELLREIVIELIRENREGFYELILEAIEEIGLANAIREGRKNKFVSEEKIFKLLEGGV